MNHPVCGSGKVLARRHDVVRVRLNIILSPSLSVCLSVCLGDLTRHTPVTLMSPLRRTHRHNMTPAV